MKLLSLAICITTALARGPGDVAGMDYNLALWENLSRNAANASNVVSFPGYNVSAPYNDDSKATNDWSMMLSIVSDVPVSRQDKPYFTGTALLLQPPQWLVEDDGEVHADESWKTACLKVYKMEELTVNWTDIKNNNGSTGSTCAGVLSDGCVDALQEKAGAGGGCDLGDLLPAACRQYGLVQSYLYTRDLVGKNIAHGLLRGMTSENHDKGNFSAYDSAIRQKYIVLTGFTLNRPQNTSKSSHGPQGALRCVWPMTFSANSRTWEDSKGITLEVGLARWIVPLVALVMLA